MAPTIEETEHSIARAQINFRNGHYSLIAERDLRAWQALLAPYALIDIDFDSPTEEFTPENETERAEIKLFNFSRSKKELIRRGSEYGVFARAFLAIPNGVPLIELMSLYRDAVVALTAGRSIDAYNQFYLFFETQFCGGRTGTQQATDQLLSRSEFMSALGSVATEVKSDRKLDSISFGSLKNWPNDQRKLVKDIVELRGKLRHHSLGSPHRWDPNKQEAFDNEALFLSLVAHQIAFPRTTGTLWDAHLLEQFTSLAKEMHMNIEIQVILTIKDDDRTQDVVINMTFPQPRANSQLARAVLTKAIELFEQRSPQAELLAIRAWTKSNKAELFRYDLGPTIGR